jgi:hypothetical protein
MIKGRIGSAAAGSGLFVVLACAILMSPALADQPVFPTGSHIGLVPPAGMTMAQTYPGFIDAANNAGILVGMLPLAAYPNIEKTLADDALKKQGFAPEKREALQLNIGKGLLVVGTEVGSDKIKYRKWMLIAKTPDLTALVTVQEPVESKAYSDSVVRASLATLAEREIVPDAELLKLLPFTVGDLADFKVANIIPGRALMLLDAPKDPHLVATPGLPEFEFDARFIIAAVPNAAPANNEDRANVARSAFSSIVGIKDIHLTMSEPVRMDDRQGFETVAQAKDANTNINIMVIQWLRFEGDRFLQMVGISRADIWSTELPRMRTMRDSVAMK